MLLKNLKENLEKTELVEVVAFATNADDFLEKVKNTKPEALLLDIDLTGNSMNGLDIANLLELPVLFVSGKTVEFNAGIEELNTNKNIPIQHISKPILKEKLDKILPKFIRDIKAYNSVDYVYLDFGEIKRNKISVDTIVYIETDTGKSGASNNKRIYFTNRKPEILYNISLSRIEEKGFDAAKFIKIRGSHRVNVDKIKCYNKNHEVEVDVCDENGKIVLKQLLVSEDFRKMVISRIA